MATPRNDSITVPAGTTTVRLGRNEPPIGPTFDSVTVTDMTSSPGSETVVNGKVLVLELHGSGGSNTTQGRQYAGSVSGPMAYDVHNVFRWNIIGASVASAKTVTGAWPYLLRPVDNYGVFSNNGRRESMWLGFQHIPGNDFKLITWRRLHALVEWARVNLKHDLKHFYLTGGSMGAWGTLYFGLRKPNTFAALYPDRPRWRSPFAQTGKYGYADYTATQWVSNVDPANVPVLSDEDGGGSLISILDNLSYVADTNNKIPWIGWCCGSNDGYASWEDQITAVNVLRTAKRAFAFYWNAGDHSTGAQLGQILRSYKYGMFELGKGYPRFFNHSLDKVPGVDAVGGINIGLAFQNVVESAAGWSCEVQCIDGACTVDVEPISDVFKATVTPKTITIPDATTWVPVSFSA